MMVPVMVPPLAIWLMKLLLSLLPSLELSVSVSLHLLGLLLLLPPLLPLLVPRVPTGLLSRGTLGELHRRPRCGIPRSLHVCSGSSKPCLPYAFRRYSFVRGLSRWFSSSFLRSAFARRVRSRFVTQVCACVRVCVCVCVCVCGVFVRANRCARERTFPDTTENTLFLCSI